MTDALKLINYLLIIKYFRNKLTPYVSLTLIETKHYKEALKIEQSFELFNKNTVLPVIGKYTKFCRTFVVDKLKKNI